MRKTWVRMKAIVYAVSPFQQKVISGLWKDLPNKIHKRSPRTRSAPPSFLTHLGRTYVQNYQEKEKLAHRQNEEPKKRVRQRVKLDPKLLYMH
ncbi:hypothetical protein HHK36_027557 [Tetracentron sinense]|uniref:Uncharacterized protein n=1 Tax=Tetracentron sinense TaxID=13715 RepID=A0A834YHR2_TETSI|nr:hypothetical protein HHK36_027557 [Tetracentron sinense]